MWGGTSAILTSGLAYKNMSSLQRSIVTSALASVSLEERWEIQRAEMIDMSDRREAVIWPIKASLQPTDTACGTSRISRTYMLRVCRCVTSVFSAMCKCVRPLLKGWAGFTLSSEFQLVRALLSDRTLTSQHIKTSLFFMHCHSPPNLQHLFSIHPFSLCSTALFSRVDPSSVISSPFFIPQSPLKSTLSSSVSPPSPLSELGLRFC